MVGARGGGNVLAEVRSRVPGGVAGVPTVLVELAQDRTTLRELIRLAVTEQVAELRANPARCRQLLDRQYLTDAEASVPVQRGVVSNASPVTVIKIVVEVEVERALLAFEQRTFVVFND